MAKIIIKNNKLKTNAGYFVGKGKPKFIYGGRKIGRAMLETSGDNLQKLKRDLSYHLSIPHIFA